MTDVVKPFACPSPGCSMSFANENNLIVHKKKHDMVLNLGNNGKNNVFVADQTPTPTRFIRNCEEVGLFQDLQNVNPFEETFRRAVEAGNTGTLSVPEVEITDDTLHTPHIFPHIEDVLSENSQILSDNNRNCTSIAMIGKSTVGKISLEEQVCTDIKLNSHNSEDLMKNNKYISLKNELLADNIIVQNMEASVSPKIVSTNSSQLLSINGEEVQLLLKTADGKLMQLSAFPVSDSNNICTSSNQTKQQAVVIRTQPPLKCSVKVDSKKLISSRLSLAKMKLKQVLTKKVGFQNEKSMDDPAKREMVITSLKKGNQNKTIDQHKKRELLERNRASSMRARAKRKAWIQQLERTVANVNETNAALQMEVKALRSELAKLKGLLLAHKDCPVTKAMQKGNSICIGPKIISVNPDLVNTAASNSILSLKRSTLVPSDIANLTKKKIPLISSKNPVILPKVDCNIGTPIQNGTIVKNIPTIKIVGMGQLLAEKEDVKPILIMQNSPSKLNDTTSRQIIQINPNYEIEHAASKNSGRSPIDAYDV